MPTRYQEDSIVEAGISGLFVVARVLCPSLPGLQPPHDEIFGLPNSRCLSINVARDRWRKKTPLDFTDLGGEEIALLDPTPGPEDQLSRKEALERLARGVEKLRPEYRMVIALRYDAGLSYKQIASALEIPLNTVRTYLRRAKSVLRLWMEAEDG